MRFPFLLCRVNETGPSGLIGELTGRILRVLPVERFDVLVMSPKVQGRPPVQMRAVAAG
jgi:hypothetical protein